MKTSIRDQKEEGREEGHAELMQKGSGEKEERMYTTIGFLRNTNDKKKWNERDDRAELQRIETKSFITVGTQGFGSDIPLSITTQPIPPFSLSRLRYLVKAVYHNTQQQGQCASKRKEEVKEFFFTFFWLHHCIHFLGERCWSFAGFPIRDKEGTTNKGRK